MPKNLLPLLILAALALASCSGTGTPSAVDNGNSFTTPDAGDQTMSAEEARMLGDLNAARAVARVCGSRAMPAAAPVTWNGYLARAARAHALDMAVNGYFGHVSPVQGSVHTRARAAGYTGWKELGENIAAGEHLDTVLAAWLASPSHCATLMDAGLKEVGLAYLYRPGSLFGTYFVQDFGTR